MIAGGIFYGAGTVGIILLFWLGSWSARSEHERIMWIALIGISYALGSIAVTISCAVGGPVGRFKMDASRSGVGFDLSSDDQPAATVTTTTAVTTPTPKGPGQ